MQRIEHDTEEREIDEFYQEGTRQAMNCFKRHLDPYLNVGDEISVIF